MRRNVLFLLLCIACDGTPPKHPIAAAAPGGSPTAAKATAPDEPGPAPLSGLADEGTFSFLVNETPIAQIAFVWRADGSYQANVTVSYAGQTVKQSSRIDVDGHGRWTRMEIQAPTGTMTIVRDGLKLTITARDKTTTTELAPNAVLFENFSPALMAAILRAYPTGATGTQNLPLMVPGAPQMEAKVTRKENTTRALDGRDLVFGRWQLEVAGVEVEVLTDEQGRVVFGDVPAQHAAYVRHGYEPLLTEATVEPKLSRPEHEVTTDLGVKVAMRDMVELTVDVYRPSTAGKHPTVVVRTPYRRELNELQGRYFARRGYAYVVQDVRGRGASGGLWVPFVNEKLDGHDTIEWAARQPWSNGKVGMIGPSYLGLVQWLAAVEKPKHLVTMIPNVAPPDPFFNIPYEHGAFFLLGAIWWADVVATDAAADLSGLAMQKIGDKKYAQLLRSLPVIDLDKAVLGGENKHWREWLAHPTQDAYWAGASYLDALTNVDLPVFHQSGWFDGDGIGSKLSYARMAKLERKHQKLILGPWGHTDTASRGLAGEDFGPEAVAIDLQREYLRWFDYWLKGVDNGTEREPLVRIFAMGSNRWLTGNTYPLEGTILEKWHLASDGQANGLKGNGRLVRAAGGAETDAYVYDPGDPTPEPSYYEEPERAKGAVTSEGDLKEAREGWRDKVLTERKDILVFTGEPMADDTTFAGPVSAVLYAATTAKDTDWFMTLSVIRGGAKPFPLVQGRLRARYRASMSKPTLLTPGKVEKYVLDLWQTGITVKKGERLRVEVASAAFPMWSRNLNTGENNETGTTFEKATQTIYHSTKYPSHVLLPRVKQ